MRSLLNRLDGETYVSASINLNSFSDAPSLQPILEGPLEKKSGELDSGSLCFHQPVHVCCF